MAIESRLEHQTFTVKDLVEDYRLGRIVIPEFQREYVWKPSMAPKLVDSLYRGFPISSFLLWKNTNASETTRTRRREPKPRSTDIFWLIDGQQRIITLSRLLNGDDGIDVVFHPDDEQFKLNNAATKRDSNWFRISDLCDDDSYRKLRRNLVDSPDADRWEARFEEVRRIRNYNIPVVRMMDHSFANAVNAFTRINTMGVKLKYEDIESAKIAARHTGFIADNVAPFLKKLHQQGFNRLNVMHLFRACAFVAKPDGRNRTPLHEMKRSEVIQAWKTTEKATNDAIGLIRSELGLVNMNILWSGALIVPLIAIYTTISPQKLDSNKLIGWLSLAALCHRYSSSSESALEQDLRACHSSDPIGALLHNLRNDRSLEAKPKDFSGTLADRGGLLALYIACMHRGIRNFYTGGKVLLQNNVDRHHILPRAQFSEKERLKADNVANMAFIAGDVNKSIGQTGPEIYLKKIKKGILKSQCIPIDSTLWKIEKAEAFWRKRCDLLAESFNEYIRKLLPQRHL